MFWNLNNLSFKNLKFLFLFFFLKNTFWLLIGWFAHFTLIGGHSLHINDWRNCRFNFGSNQFGVFEGVNSFNKMRSRSLSNRLWNTLLHRWRGRLFWTEAAKLWSFGFLAWVYFERSWSWSLACSCLRGLVNMRVGHIFSSILACFTWNWQAVNIDFDTLKPPKFRCRLSKRSGSTKLAMISILVSHKRMTSTFLNLNYWCFTEQRLRYVPSCDHISTEKAKISRVLS